MAHSYDRSDLRGRCGRCGRLDPVLANHTAPVPPRTLLLIQRHFIAGLTLGSSKG